MKRSLAQRPGHRATTATLQAVYPFAAQAGLGGRGVYIGRDLYGGSFAYDPFTLYERRALTNPNMLVIGEVGSGKSALVKSYLLRQALFGRVPWISDPKGEYTSVAEALGCSPIRLIPGGSARVNPIADRTDPEGQLALLQAIAAAALGRELDSEERAALREALRVLDALPDEEPTLPRVVHLLLHPIVDMANRLATTPAQLAMAVRSAALALQRLCDGELRGMFDGPTSSGLRLDGPAVVLDLSAFYDSSALGIVMTCAAAWQRTAMTAAHRRADAAGTTPPKFINVFDEAWRAISLIGVGEWLQDAFKKSRAYGLQNIVVMHRLSDLQAAGDAGSREVALAEGLLHDAQTRVVYRQTRDEVPRTEKVLGLSQLEAELVPDLAPGVALWRVGGRSFLVQHRLSDYEAPIVDTDGRMRERVIGWDA
jgi:type IV secretory pathway VirB4 component